MAREIAGGGGVVHGSPLLPTFSARCARRTAELCQNFVVIFFLMKNFVVIYLSVVILSSAVPKYNAYGNAPKNSSKFLLVCSNIHIFVQAMPTLVWRVRPVSGTSAAGSGGSTAHQGEATVPDPVVSVSAGPATSSGVAIPADSSNHADADGGKKRKKRKIKSHAEAATAATKKSKAVSERDLPTGVYKALSRKRFESQIHWGGKKYYIGTFASPEQASAIYALIRKERKNVELSALGADEVDAAFDAAKKKAIEAVGGFVLIKRAKATSERDLPQGVYKTKYGKFKSAIRWGSRERYIGIFDTPEQAFAANMFVRKDLEHVNLSALGIDEVNALFETAKIKAVEAVDGFIPRKRAKTSERDLPTGVSKTSSGKFLAKLQWGGKKYYIGTFDTPEQASAAYVLVRKEIGDAKLSTRRDDEVNALFEAAKTKAVEAVGVLV